MSIGFVTTNVTIYVDINVTRETNMFEVILLLLKMVRDIKVITLGIILVFNGRLLINPKPSILEEVLFNTTSSDFSNFMRTTIFFRPSS